MNAKAYLDFNTTQRDKGVVGVDGVRVSSSIGSKVGSNMATRSVDRGHGMFIDMQVMCWTIDTTSNTTTVILLVILIHYILFQLYLEPASFNYNCNYITNCN